VIARMVQLVGGDWNSLFEGCEAEPGHPAARPAPACHRKCVVHVRTQSTAAPPSVGTTRPTSTLRGSGRRWRVPDTGDPAAGTVTSAAAASPATTAVRNHCTAAPCACVDEGVTCMDTCTVFLVEGVILAMALNNATCCLSQGRACSSR
jgi:hypothetical protein